MNQQVNNDDLSLEQIADLLKALRQELNTEQESDKSDLEQLIDLNTEELEKELYYQMNTKDLKVCKIHPDAVIPKYNYPTDSGFDIHSVEEIIIPAFGRALIPTGLRFQFEEGFEIQIRTKSGLAINQGLMVLNSPGTVDQGYSGEIKVPLFNTNSTSVIIHKGMKVAQGVLCPVQNGRFVNVSVVDKLDETDRGDKGFGSTGI